MRDSEFVNFTLEKAMKFQKGSRGMWLYSFFDLGVSWWWVVNTTPQPLYPKERREETRYPSHSRLGGPQRRSGQVQKIPPSPGLDPRIFQPRLAIPGFKFIVTLNEFTTYSAPKPAAYEEIKVRTGYRG